MIALILKLIFVKIFFLLFINFECIFLIHTLIRYVLYVGSREKGISFSFQDMDLRNTCNALGSRRGEHII